MYFYWIDTYTEEDTPPTSIEAQDAEINDLVNIAKYVPCIHWEYDETKGGPASNGDQLGFITQALLKVPGLASAVTTDENGVHSFDSRFVAAASLSLVAALARKVLDIKLSEDYARDDTRETVAEPVSETNGTAETNSTDTASSIQ